MPDNDDILSPGGAGGGQTSQQNSTTTPTNPPSNVDPASVTKAVREAIGDLPGELRSYTEAITKYVDQRIGGGTQAPAPQATPTDDTQRILSDPRGLVTEVLNDTLKRELAPYLTTKINDDFDTLMDNQRARIDRTWGEGAFDSLIAKDVNETASRTPNAAARGSKDYIAALVRGRVGHEDVLPKLQAHKAKFDAEHKDDNMADSGGAFLDAGRRRPKNDSPFSEGDEAFMADYVATTGLELDKKLLGEALKVRNRDGVWDTQNFPGVKNKLNVKAPRGKNYGAGRT